MTTRQDYDTPPCRCLCDSCDGAGYVEGSRYTNWGSPACQIIDVRLPCPTCRDAPKSCGRCA